MRTFAIALFLIVLTVGTKGKAWAASPQCDGTGVNYFCTQLTGEAAGAPDSVNDIGPLPYYGPNGSIAYYTKVEQCRVVWNSPYYVWTAWTVPGTSCDQFWNSTLGTWSAWGYNQSPHSYYAPVLPPGN